MIQPHRAIGLEGCGMVEMIIRPNKISHWPSLVFCQGSGRWEMNRKDTSLQY